MKKTNSSSARLFGKIATLSAAVALASCITVNVNFPETAVQAAANDFVRDLYKNPTPVADNDADTANSESESVKNSVKRSSKKKKTPASESKPIPAPHTSFFMLGLAEAFAQEINTATPKATEIKNRMKTRVPQVSKWKEKGVICETSDGMLVAKNPAKAGADASEVAKLVKSENDDRDELYAEIADANRINDRKQTKIRKFFSAAFRENSPKGTCFEE